MNDVIDLDKTLDKMEFGNNKLSDILKAACKETPDLILFAFLIQDVASMRASADIFIKKWAPIGDMGEDVEEYEIVKKFKDDVDRVIQDQIDRWSSTV